MKMATKSLHLTARSRMNRLFQLYVLSMELENEISHHVEPFNSGEFYAPIHMINDTNGFYIFCYENEIKRKIQRLHGGHILPG